MGQLLNMVTCPEKVDLCSQTKPTNSKILFLPEI